MHFIHFWNEQYTKKSTKEEVEVQKKVHKMSSSGKEQARDVQNDHGLRILHNYTVILALYSYDADPHYHEITM